MAKLVNQTIFASKIKAKKLYLFGASDVRALFGLSAVATASLLHRYKKVGFIAQPKRGIYAFPDALPPDVYLANKLHTPSYVSLEWALSYHGVIPETVYEVTSVTTKATREIEILGKVFSYRKIKKSAFTGYEIGRQNGISFYLATAEKALVDLSYVRMINGEEPISRFNKDKVNTSKVLKYASLFNSPRLVSVTRRILGAI